MNLGSNAGSQPRPNSYTKLLKYLKIIVHRQSLRSGRSVTDLTVFLTVCAPTVNCLNVRYRQPLSGIG